jgi:nucleoside-diphosphate-sugar epimerase
MKILVAGGAGFIGSHLCEKLLKKGYEVFCVDNLLTGNKKNIEGFLGNKKFHFINWDVVQKPPQGIASKRFDFIFHLASSASPNPESPLSYLNYPAETLFVNSLGTYNLLELANQNKAKFLFASTSEIYGDPQISPQPETYWGNVNPAGIRSCYDEAKRFGESMTMVFVRKFKVNARIVRIFNTYGPKMDKRDGRVIVNFINQALGEKPLTVYGKGTQTRSFCYIDDTIKGIMKAMFEKKTAGEVFNIGNNKECTILQLAKMINKLLGNNIKIIYKILPIDDPTNRCPDITKAKKILGWEPKVSLKEGLLKTIEYFNEK